jgi:hypothetical protein
MFVISYLMGVVQSTAGVVCNAVFGAPSPAAAPAAAPAHPESTTAQNSSNTSIIITGSAQEASVPVTASTDTVDELQVASNEELIPTAAPLSEINSTIDQRSAVHSSMACNSSTNSEDGLFADCTSIPNIEPISTSSSTHSSNLDDSGSNSSNATAATSLAQAALHCTAAATASVRSAAESVESAPMQHQQLPGSKRDPKSAVQAVLEEPVTAPNTPLSTKAGAQGFFTTAVYSSSPPEESIPRLQLHQRSQHKLITPGSIDLLLLRTSPRSSPPALR